MRIIGEFDVENIKITVFKMNERISIKFEENLLEQTYKFRDGSAIQNLEDAQRFCNEDTIQDIKNTFTNMSELRSKSLSSMLEDTEEFFDEIL